VLKGRESVAHEWGIEDVPVRSLIARESLASYLVGLSFEST
jgi:hypothetical protein